MSESKPGTLSFDPEEIRKARQRTLTDEPMCDELRQSARRIREQRKRAETVSTPVSAIPRADDVGSAA